MTINFCTLFNANYLSRGIVLYESLLKVCADFHLYVFAFDDKTYEYLKARNYDKLTVISLKEFEDEQLLGIKSTRSAAEYCWTCTPSTILFALKKFNLQNCTYIDADLCFYSDPKVLLEEMNGKSVIITEHRYTKQHDQSALSGKYCVQFVTALNNRDGLEVMEWWRNACIDWCYARQEDGKFGDQKYLDDWTTRFNCVHELQHLGGGVAPWNIQQYSFTKQDDKIIGKELKSGKSFEVVFLHFHGLRIYDGDIVSITDHGYKLTEVQRELFFIPYVKALMNAKRKINSYDDSFNPNGSSGPSPFSISKRKALKQYYLQGLRASKKNILGLQVPKKLRRHYFLDASKF